MFANFRQLCLGRQTPPEERCLIIGEVAQSHDGSLGMAHAFIDAIARAGADAVKFQTHIAAAESTLAEPWRVKFSLQDATRYDYWRRMEFSAEQWAGLKQHAEECGLLFLSTPFSFEAAELLRRIGMNVWKIASGEVGNLPLLEYIADGGNPLILSSGMSSWFELDEAITMVKHHGNPFAVLQCTSAYPCPPEGIGLNLIPKIKERYGCPSGLSDHSGKIYASLFSTMFGAEVLEIHVTLSGEMFGPDVTASITTCELSRLVEGVRFGERMLANPVDKDQKAAELKPLRQIFTQSIYAGANLSAGTILTREDLRLKKPGNGIPAAQLPNLIGCKLRRNLRTDEMILLEDVELI